MARGVPRTRFHRSRLIRVLEALAVGELSDPRQSFGERLGHWLDFKDAIALYSVLNSPEVGAAPASTASPEAAALATQLASVRAGVVAAIEADGLPDSGKAARKLHAMALGLRPEDGADFVPYHRYYLAHQRNMQVAVGSLRARVRAAVAGGSPELRRLAALDAVLEQSLAARERSVLASIPGHLGKRFEALQQAHRAARAESAETDEQVRWLQPGGWLATFCEDMQALLLAELDLRLEPVAGLVEALGKERPQGRAAPSPPPEGDEKAWGGPAFSHERPQGRAAPSPPPEGDEKTWGGPANS